MREVVFDTNVLVAALRSKRGASYRLVKLIGLGLWRLNISVALALEYEEVLKRQGAMLNMTTSDVDDFLDYIFQASKLVPSVVPLRPALRDADDDHILELAVECQATIVTHNVKDFAGSDRFGIRVQTPGEFLKGVEPSL